MAMRKESKALLVTPRVNASKWVNATSRNRSGGQVKTASEALSKYDPSKWLLSHVTIMASVDLEEAKSGDPKSAYLIKPEHSIFVNNNGDCWERDLLAATYKTFVGANNYVEHVQLPEHSKGKVIDAAIREVDLGLDSRGNPLTTLYVDLLIATSWEYPDICNKILTGEYNAVSMGCLIQYSTCSRCGKTAKDESEHCEHIRFYRRNTFYDDNGNKRIIAEICGDKKDPSSVTFIDASWVRKPAFPGAVIRNIVSPPKAVYQAAKAAARGTGDPLMENVKSREVIKTEHHDVSAFAKAASMKIAEGEDDSSARFGEPAEAPAEGKSDADFPEPEAGAGGDAGAGADSLFGEDAAADPADPQTTPEEAQATPLDSIKKEIQDGLMLQIKQQLMDQVNEAFKDKNPTEEVGEDNADTESIFRQSDSLVKEASSHNTARYLQDKYSVDVTKIQNVKLAASLMAMASVPKLSDISKLGFTRKDAAAVLRFVDERRNGQPVGDDVVQHVVDHKGPVDKDYMLKFVLDNVRRPSDHEKKVLRTWPAILDGI